MNTISLDRIAAEAKLSKQTVSHILNTNRRSKYAASTVDRVVILADQLGYRPNRAARALSTGKTHLVGLWMTEARSPYYSEILKHLDAQVRAHGYEPVVSFLRGDIQSQLQSIGGGGWQVDGVLSVDPLVASLVTADAREAMTRAASQAPFVSLGNFCLTFADHVSVDLSGASDEVMRHLFTSGCKRIAFLAESGSDVIEDSRFAAYRRAMADRGLPERLMISPERSRASYRQTVVESIVKHGGVDAIFCHDDDKAIAANRALRDVGLRVPDDVVLVGCDGIEELEYLDSPVSTIVQPVEEMCRRAWKFLEARMARPDAPRQAAVLQPELIVRTSSKLEKNR